MRRRLKLNIAVVLFLCFTVLAAYLILTRDKGNSFQIQRDDTSPSAQTDTAPQKPEDTTPTPANDENEKETDTDTAAKDWTAFIEKYRGKEIIKVNTTEKAVALTFDAGANGDGVEKVLPILEENNIKGTFFLTGKFIEKYPEKVKAIMASGGDIGNHSYDHPYLTHLSSEEIVVKIKGAEDAFAKLDGKFQPFFRSPYGDRNTSTLSTISDTGYINIRWTVDSLGWKGTSGGQTKTSVEQKVLKNSSPGAIIMMHLGSNPDDKSHLDSQALPDIIAKLKADGYEFMTLSELLKLEK